jgi:hypothetical protein
LRIQAAGYGTLEEVVKGPEVLGDVVLDEESRIVGTVLFGRSRLRAPNAVITVRYSDFAEQAPVTIAADANGDFIVGELPPGRHTIFASHGSMRTLQGTQVVLTPGRPTRVELKLASGQEVAGSLTRVTPETCSGALVTLAGAAGAFQVVTKGSGFRFNNVPDGDYQAIVECRGYRQVNGNEVIRIGSTPLGGSIEIPVEPALTIAGVVHSLSEGFGAETSIQVLGADGRVHHAQLAERGRFAVGGLSEGVYEVVPVLRNSGLKLAKSQRLALTNGIPAPFVEFVLGERSTVLTRCALAAAVPPARISVTAREVASNALVAAESRADGVHSFLGLVPGNYRFMISLNGSAPRGLRGEFPAESTFVPAGGELELPCKLPQGTGRISGRVVGDDGSVVSDAWISLTALPNDADGLQSTFRVASGLDGSFSFDGLSDDEFELRARPGIADSILTRCGETSSSNRRGSVLA